MRRRAKRHEPFQDFRVSGLRLTGLGDSQGGPGFVVLAVARAIRTQTQYKGAFQSTLVAHVSTLLGCGRHDEFSGVSWWAESDPLEYLP